MSTEEEPVTKKVKTAEDWSNHKLNISEAIKKEDEGRSLTDLANEKIHVLQGIGPKADAILEAAHIKTVKDLGNNKYFKIARAISDLASAESTRPADSVMNLDKAVDKEYHTKTLKELLEAPISALYGLTDKANELFGGLGVKSIGDLAELKYCKWASAIVELSAFEETKTAEERHKERELKKLS